MAVKPDEKHSRRIRGNSRVTVEMAREHRHAMTEAEAILWQALRSNRLDGLRFRSQHPVGPFILDFYCPRGKLAVEVDGSIHDEIHERDMARTEQIEAYGYRLIRFSNDQVLTDLPGVLDAIRLAARDQLAANPVPVP